MPGKLFESRLVRLPDRQETIDFNALPRASQALSRFTVLDLTRVRSGPTCVRPLADWGANIIKIDALLDDAAGEQPGGPRRGSDFQNLHRNKRAMIPSPKAMSARSSSPRSIRITPGSGSPLATSPLFCLARARATAPICASRAGWAAPTRPPK
jgi:hypothetical protein